MASFRGLYLGTEVVELEAFNTQESIPGPGI